MGEVMVGDYFRKYGVAKPDVKRYRPGFSARSKATVYEVAGLPTPQPGSRFRPETATIVNPKVDSNLYLKSSAPVRPSNGCKTCGSWPVFDKSLSENENLETCLICTSCWGKGTDYTVRREGDFKS